MSDGGHPHNKDTKIYKACDIFIATLLAAKGLSIPLNSARGVTSLTLRPCFYLFCLKTPL